MGFLSDHAGRVFLGEKLFLMRLFQLLGIHSWVELDPANFTLQQIVFKERPLRDAVNPPSPLLKKNSPNS